MSQVDRRRFVQIGAAAAAVTAVAPFSSDAHGRREDQPDVDRTRAARPVVHRIAAQPGRIENIDDPSCASLWAFTDIFPAEAELLATPFLLDETTVLSLTSDDSPSSVIDETTAAFVRALDRANTIGGYTSPELAAALLTGVLLGTDFNVALEFYSRPADPDLSVSMIAGIPVATESRGTYSRVAPLETPYPNITVGAWRLQFRPNHPPGKGHKMGDCAPTGSPHIHFEICYNRTGKRWDILNTLHVGKYSQSGKKCVFISNDPEKSSRPFCKKVCVPTFRDLQRMYEAALTAAAAAAGIAIAAWLVAAIASAAAAATYGAVLAL